MKKKDGLKIMLVDYDKHVRESLKLFFKTSQNDFLIFKSASQGLNSLKHQRVEVVISDYFLPDMNGIEFLKEAARIQPEVRRILIATMTCGDMEDQVQQEGIDRFLEKPLTVASLDTVIDEMENLNVSNHSRR
ncbi:MAG: response regulator [Desulfobacterales bacterium]|nr:response regulator [Desulfobacterales bacterium]